MKYIKWGVLGCSADVMPVVRLLNEMEGSQVVAVMDDDAAVAKSCGAELGISSYSGVQDLIDDSEVNAVYIATVPSTMPPMPSFPCEAVSPCWWKRLWQTPIGTVCA